MKRKKNPFDVAEKWLKRVGQGLIVAIYGALIVGSLVVYPIVQFANGAAWYDALIPWIVLIGVVFGLLLLMLIVGLVATAWSNGRRNWNRRHR